MTNKNTLWDADQKLFASMKNNSITHEEFNFFRNMEYKEQNEPTLSNDLIMSEKDNADKIYIVREVYDEYVIGCSLHPEDEVHVMNLAEALSTNLQTIGLIDKDETLWSWLRSINYKGITYNRNYDNI